MSSNLTTAAFIFKRKFGGARVPDLAMRDHPRFKMTTKKPGFTGDSLEYNILTGNPQSISGTFASAQGNTRSSKGKKPRALRRPKFGVIRIDSEAMAAAEGNDAAFYNLVNRETTGVVMEMGDNFAFDLYRDGTGARGEVLSINGNEITLLIADDARNFKEGMLLIADNDASGASPKSGSCTVEKISESGGKIVVDNAAGISGLAQGDKLFRHGDPGTCMEGLAVCTPLVEPDSSDDFREINRSSNPSRLAGSRVSDLAASVEENMGRGAVFCQQVGVAHTPRFGYLNPIRFHEVARRQSAKVQFTEPGGVAKIGFQFIEIVTSTGSMRVYSDPDCPTNRGYGCLPDYEYIHTLKGLPHLDMSNGREWIPQSGASGIEVRVNSWCNYIQEDPASHFVIEI